MSGQPRKVELSMKIIKLLLVLVTVTSIMLGVCGCMNNNITSPEYVREKALEYLAANYDDTFTVVAYTDGGWAYDYSSVFLTSPKMESSEKQRGIVWSSFMSESVI